MARRAIVHIGTFKTGSTSIQAFIDANAERLALQGIHVPASIGRPNQHGLAIYALSERETTGLIRFYGLLDRERREAKRAEVAAALNAEMAALPETITTVIFSNEHLSGLNRASEVERLKELLAPHFETIDIVVYLRRQDLRIVSDYTQKVRDGYSKRLNLRDYKPSEGLDLVEFLDKWAGVFGASALIPRIFARSDFVGGDLISDFIAATGIKNDPSFRHPPIENVGLSHKAIHFLRVFNDYVPHYVDGERNEMRTRLLPYLAEAFPGDGLKIARRDAVALMGDVADANAAVGEKYFGRAEIFSDDFSRYAEEGECDPNFEDAIEIAAALWNRQAETIATLRNQLAALRVLAIGSSDKARVMAKRIFEADEENKAYYPTFLESFDALHAELRETRLALEKERAARDAS